MFRRQMCLAAFFGLMFFVAFVKVEDAVEREKLREKLRQQRKKANEDAHPKRNVTCKIKTRTMSIKPGFTGGVPVADFCWFCGKTECGRQATDIILGDIPSTCVAREIKACCPQVISVEQDNQGLCECFCESMTYVRGSGKNKWLSCPNNCRTYPPAYQHGKQGDHSGGSGGVSVVVTISVTGLIFLALGALGFFWFRRKNHANYLSAQRQILFNRFRGEQNEYHDVNGRESLADDDNDSASVASGSVKNHPATEAPVPGSPRLLDV